MNTLTLSGLSLLGQIEQVSGDSSWIETLIWWAIVIAAAFVVFVFLPIAVI